MTRRTVTRRLLRRLDAVVLALNVGQMLAQLLDLASALVAPFFNAVALQKQPHSLRVYGSERPESLVVRREVPLHGLLELLKLAYDVRLVVGTAEKLALESLVCLKLGCV